MQDWSRGPTSRIAGITNTYPIAHERSHIEKKPLVNPRLRAIRAKEIIPVVITPIERAKAILRFIKVPIASLQM
jgi:hypothetical protein